MIRRRAANSELLRRAAIAGGVAALIGIVLRPLLLAPDKLPGIDAHNFYAWETYTRAVFGAGRLPFWNPYFFTGIPHIADIETQVLYPPALALRWLPIPAYLTAMVALHLWIAGMGGLVLARVAGTGWISAAAAAIAMTLGGSVAPWIHNGHLLLLESAAFMPWILAFALLSMARRSWLPRTGLLVACGLQFLTGYLQGSVYVAAALTALYGFTMVWPAGAARHQLLKQWALTGMFTGGLVAFQLLPTTVLVQQAGRTAKLPWEAAAEGGWGAADLVRIVRPFAGLQAGTSYRDLSDGAVYVGILLALLAPLAFVSRDRRRLAVFFALLAAAGIALASAAWLPIYRWHYALFPGLRIPGRVLFVTTVSLAMLGALGLEEVLRFTARRSLTGARIAGVVALAIVTLDVAGFAAPAVEPVSVSSASPIVAAAVGRSGGRILSLCEHRVAATEMLALQRPSLDGIPGIHLGAYADWAAIARFGERPPHDGMYRRVSTDGDLPARRDLIDASNVTTVLSCGSRADASLEPVASDGVVTVYHNAAAWPRAVWICGGEAASAAAVMTRLLQTSVSRDVVARYSTQPPIQDDGSELLVGTRPCGDRAVVFVQAQDRSDGKLTLRYDAPRDGVLFVSEAFYPERRAYVDGREVPTVKANVAFTAIPVPAGRHRVELRYVPVSFFLGAGITTATIFAWAILAWRRHRISRMTSVARPKSAMA
jgi:hypothetical protein